MTSHEHARSEAQEADRSQARAQSGAGLEDSPGPEDVTAPQQGMMSCRALSPALSAGGCRTTTGQSRE